MKALVVYESMFGNTEQIARAIADGLGDIAEVTLADVASVPSAEGVDLLVVGGPTHAFGMSRPGTRQEAGRKGTVRPGTSEVGLREFLARSPMLTGVAAAAFDTRADKPRLPGSAAHKAQRQLRRLGCRPLVAPESFRVADMCGPLLAGERERARQWAAGVAATLTAQQHLI